MRGARAWSFWMWIGALGGLLGLSILGEVAYGAPKKVELKAVKIREPIAVLLEIEGTGVLTRGGVSYDITSPGIGFKRGDKFELPAYKNGSVDAYAVISLNRPKSGEEGSYVRLEEGAKIVFLDDDGSVAITGVYVESESPSTPSSLVFLINHASTESPFFVWTPDVVVGVRGTYFEVKPANSARDYPTEVIGYNAVDGSEVDEIVGTIPGKWDPDDLRLVYLIKDEVINFLKTHLPPNTTIPNLVDPSAPIPVGSLYPFQFHHVISAFYYMMKHYSDDLKAMLEGNSGVSLPDLGLDIKKASEVDSSLSDVQSIHHTQPTSCTPISYVSQKISGGKNNVVWKFSTVGPNKIIDLYYLITENPSCLSGGTCTYKVYKVGKDATAYDVARELAQRDSNLGKNFVAYVVQNYGDPDLSISFVGFGGFGTCMFPPVPTLTYNVTTGSGGPVQCNYTMWSTGVGMMGASASNDPACPKPADAGDKIDDILEDVTVRVWLAEDVTSSPILIKPDGNSVVIKKPGLNWSISLDAEHIFPTIKMDQADPLPEEKKVKTLKEKGKKHHLLKNFHKKEGEENWLQHFIEYFIKLYQKLYGD